MADLRRFELFAHLLTRRFPDAPRVWDVAGGQGRLNQALTELGREVTTFDVRRKHLPVNYQERLLLPDEPCACDLVVGMHPDGATRVVVDYAAKHGLPFAVVPCCSDNGMSYKPWLRFVADLARERGFDIELADLPMAGRAKVVLGFLRQQDPALADEQRGPGPHRIPFVSGAAPA